MSEEFKDLFRKVKQEEFHKFINSFQPPLYYIVCRIVEPEVHEYYNPLLGDREHSVMGFYSTIDGVTEYNIRKDNQ